MIEVIEPSLSELIFVSYDGDFDENTGAYHGQGRSLESFKDPILCF